MLNMYRCMNRTSIYQTLEINQAQWYAFPFPIPRHSCALIKGEVGFFLKRNVFLDLYGELYFQKTDIVSISNRTEGATRDNQLNQISLSRFLFRVKRLKSILAPSNVGGRVRGPGPFTFFFLKCNFFWWGINFQANQPFHFYLNFSLLKPMLYVLARYPCY